MIMVSVGHMRLGTWNLEGKWSDAHAPLMTDAACDIWLLTEMPTRTTLPGFTIHATRARMAPERAWAAVAVRTALSAKPWKKDPHPASACADVGGLTFCSSVLPWRSCGGGDPWQGDDTASRTKHAVGRLVAALPAASTVWGGDWNHAFDGTEAAGSLGGREEIRAGLTLLGAELLTASQPHRLQGLFSIDHIAVPSGRLLTREARRLSMQSGGRHLSDHDAYVADVELAG